ncbi:MAG TPA: di-trans,poly-cis-decaprenylcistransferase [Gammaproteobacteria bacterium]|nr:di-trans,poly-cis-decaprenylcistransferase [Gammaproteobacteria bacterium]
MTPPESNDSHATPDPQQGIPRHVAVIMDGNGRWATSRGMSRINGHRKGAESVREIIRSCAKRGVAGLTLFAFSSENWRRPQREVRLLMELFISVLEKDIDALVKNGIRLKIIGDLDRFGTRINRLIKKAELRTADNDRMQLLIAANYGGRWDITQASKKLAAKVANGELQLDDINEDLFEAQLLTYGYPEPDLFIRTGGEKRISNFLIWQLAYTELYFTEVLWPDFKKADLDDAIAWYAGRERRFGQTSAQLDQADHA